MAIITKKANSQRMITKHTQHCKTIRRQDGKMENTGNNTTYETTVTPAFKKAKDRILHKAD